MRSKRLVIFSLILIAPAVVARAEDRLRVFANGSFNVVSIDAKQSYQFTHYAEDATIDTAYTFDRGPGFELGVQFDVIRHFGVAVSYARTMRNGKATFDASFPHPLYLNQPRKGTGTVTDLGFTEQDFFFNLVGTGSTGKFTYGVFAGIGYFKVNADLVAEVAYTQSYPYDSVALQPVQPVATDDGVVGFDLGVQADYHLSRHLGLGLGARYSSAKAKPVPIENTSVDLDLGGFQLLGGIRLYF